MKTYLFFRLHEGEPFFYPVYYKGDTEACAGAVRNEGTIKVEDSDGKVIWTRES